MKKIIIALLGLTLAVSGFTQNADLVYVDGWVDIRTGGESFEAFPGDTLKPGDSVITQTDSYAELEQNNLSSIIVKPDSIFTIREIETDNGRETVLSTTVGSVSFRFGKLFGREPMVATPSMTAGIRGTELTVYAGEDGSTLIAVNSGLVTVKSQGESVDLVENEGVEVISGEAPGEKFSLLGREMDFSSWNEERYGELLADPVTGIERLGRQLDSFSGDITELAMAMKQNAELEDTLKAKQEKLKAAGEEAKAQTFYKENIEPLVLIEAPMYLNIRYHTLSALSFRRYIMGKLYLEMKSFYIMDADNPMYRDFLAAYSRIMGKFEIDIVPYMNPRDL